MNFHIYRDVILYKFTFDFGRECSKRVMIIKSDLIFLKF